VTRLQRPRASAIAAILAASLAGCAATGGADDAARRAHDLIHDSSRTLANFSGSGEHADLRTALRDACALLVFPHLASASFVVGGAAGDGVLLLREPGSETWLGPAFYSLDEAGIGLQVGLARREVVVVMRRCDDLAGLRADHAQLRLGTSLTAQAAEHGTGVEVARDARAYAIVDGAYVGAAIQLAVLSPRRDLAAAYYLRPLTVAEILSPEHPLDEALARQIRFLEGPAAR